MHVIDRVAWCIFYERIVRLSRRTHSVLPVAGPSAGPRRQHLLHKKMLCLAAIVLSSSSRQRALRLWMKLRLAQCQWRQGRRQLQKQ